MRKGRILGCFGKSNQGFAPSAVGVSHIILLQKWRSKRCFVEISKKVKNSTCIRGAKYGIICAVSTNGEVAQLVEHHVRNVGVESSNLFFSTNSMEATESGFRLCIGRAAIFV